MDEIPENFEDLPIFNNEEKPELPEPALPSQMNSNTKLKRRTLLLTRLDTSPELPSSGPQIKPGSIIPHVVGTALYPFKGESEFELQFKKGDTVVVYTIDQYTGWWQGKANQTIGYFPGSYVILPSGAEDLLLALNEDEKPLFSGFNSDHLNSKHDSDELVQESFVSSDEISDAEKIEVQSIDENIINQSTQRKAQSAPANSKLVKRGSAVRLRGNSQSSRSLPSMNQNVIQRIKQAESDYGRKCILCPCDSWNPSEFEKTICNNCRHLARMHRTLSKIITSPLFSAP